MSVIVTVIYPKTETSTFDLDYYMKTHMPLVQEKWGPHGLKNWTVTKLDESTDYSMQALLWFESKEAWAKAGEAEGPTIMGDVPNFSSEKPLLVFGEEVKRVV
ncbi:putative ethyl tert-butyl ether degradation protein [Botrytis fragariae]|uniref:Putative ethyl tert-butyl ether degradation protein n=1 Tax=Botrytis fragariae TaxID=1964551 RepID=A0A8H6AVK6_9HELO|nr:putative ethyl tert-butyl ether degradation protein [Botrytis fragariae]KAF5874363.1 putative ethyl tert-butyl ether degradation protein [Botrytis fragariae]